MTHLDVHDLLHVVLVERPEGDRLIEKHDRIRLAADHLLRRYSLDG